MATKTRVGPRGRVTIPVAVQRDTGITEQSEVVVRPGGNGVVIVETVEAIKARIRAGVPAAPPDTPYDAVAEIRAERDRETRRDEETAYQVAEVPALGADASADPGKDLLRELGLL